MPGDKQANQTDPEQTRIRKEEQARRSRRRTRQIIGVALFVLMVVGAVSIVSSVVNVVRGMLDNSAEYDEYAQRVTPIVWFDLLPFDSLETADPNALKQVCIWGVMNQLGNEIGRTENGEPMVPAVEVDRYAAALFGPGYQVQHGSFEDQVENLSYEYNESSQMYTAQATGLTPQYLASVVDIRQDGGGVRRVTVGYVNTRGSNNEIVATPDLEHPAKYMDFLFRREGDQYYLFALQVNTELEVAEQAAPSMIAPSDIPDDQDLSLPASLETPASGASDVSGASDAADEAAESAASGEGDDASQSDTSEET